MTHILQTSHRVFPKITIEAVHLSQINNKKLTVPYHVLLSHAEAFPLCLTHAAGQQRGKPRRSEDFTTQLKYMQSAFTTESFTVL